MKKTTLITVGWTLALLGCGRRDDGGQDTQPPDPGTPAPGRTVTDNGASDPGTSGNESSSEIALAALSGSLADAEGISADLAMRAPSPLRRLLRQAGDLLEASAWAAPNACPFLSVATLPECAGGKLTLQFSSCQYERLNKTFMPAVWNGSKILDFGSTCPKRLVEVTSIGRTFGPGTTRTAVNGVVLSIGTEPSGWDTAFDPPVAGGTLVTRAAAARTVTIKGLHYVAVKSASDHTKLWDHSVSTPAPITVSVDGDAGRTVSGTVAVEHNLLKYTARATLSNVKFDLGTCGCFPVSGSVSTTLSGSRTGTETLTITGCAAASYTDQKGATSQVRLVNCL